MQSIFLLSCSGTFLVQTEVVRLYITDYPNLLAPRNEGMIIDKQKLKNLHHSKYIYVRLHTYKTRMGWFRNSLLFMLIVQLPEIHQYKDLVISNQDVENWSLDDCKLSEVLLNHPQVPSHIREREVGFWTCLVKQLSGNIVSILITAS